MLEKWTKILFIEKIIISHKAKYYAKYLKSNEVKSSDTRGLRKKKKYSEENI